MPQMLLLLLLLLLLLGGGHPHGAGGGACKHARPLARCPSLQQQALLLGKLPHVPLLPAPWQLVLVLAPRPEAARSAAAALGARARLIVALLLVMLLVHRPAAAAAAAASARPVTRPSMNDNSLIRCQHGPAGGQGGGPLQVPDQAV